MVLDVNELNKNKKEIYSYLWNKNDFDMNVVKTGIKDPSYEFSFSGYSLVDYIGKSIASTFNIIKNDDCFFRKFKMACSGNGDEIKKITTLHSSSLCSLLFFFNVDNKKLSFKELEGYEFTQSYFEFKNKVIGYPSNIDVVLLGTNKKTGDKVILFLESKFSEYITKVGKKEVGISYFKEGSYSFPIYEVLEENKDFDFNKKTGFNNSQKYNEGLKQMISHYYGIRRFMNGEFMEDKEDIYKDITDYDAKEIILGEILFDDFSKVDSLKEYLEKYEHDYHSLATIINNQYENDQNKPKGITFKVLTETLHYSSLKDYISEYPQIVKYYFGNRSN